MLKYQDSLLKLSYIFEAFLFVKLYPSKIQKICPAWGGKQREQQYRVHNTFFGEGRIRTKKHPPYPTFKGESVMGQNLDASAARNGFMTVTS
jgi:hypothetical protein